MIFNDYKFKIMTLLMVSSLTILIYGILLNIFELYIYGNTLGFITLIISWAILHFENKDIEE
jgi:hypothetical protein